MTAYTDPKSRDRGRQRAPTTPHSQARPTSVSRLDQTDEQAIDRTLQGETHAFELLVGRYQDRLFNSMVCLLRDHAEAEDVVQEAMIRSYLKLRSFRGVSGFYTWLYSIALNVARSRRRKRREILMDGAQLASCAEPVADTQVDSCRIDEDANQVHAALASLEQKARSILILRHIEGCSYLTIAKILDVPLGTVRSRIHRARWQLRRKLELMGNTAKSI